ncbi:MAG: aspartate ammonia-lyase [Sphaerochaetaceae bacterium]
MKKFREEHDMIGTKKIFDDCYYGIQTERAMENFQISKISLSKYPEFVKAICQVKKAVAQANFKFEEINKEKSDAIIKACDLIISGKYIDQFPVDIIQGGAGTSTNMCANEVIANIALELCGHKKGDYEFIHPNNHVNLSQSTNDVYPTAIRIATVTYCEELEKELNLLKLSFEKKGTEFNDVIKMGRTQLQDAVPMTLGQEFNAWAVTIGEDIQRLQDAKKLLLEINLGGTAIGTGLNAPKNFSKVVTEILSKNTGRDFECAENLIEATQDCGSYIQFSGTLKRIAAKISKICNDLRLLSSGPRTGINEINLPARQPGSSIMPGKVNPVIPEVVNQVAFAVIGNDVTITLAAEAGQLELNAMEPIISFKLFSSILHMTRAFNTLRLNCIDGITANKQRCKELVDNSIGIVTVMCPIIGYEKSCQIAKEALETGKSVFDLVLEKEYLSKEKLQKLLNTSSMC